jgi:hypothetical protein
MEQHALKNVNNCLNTNIHLYLEKPGGQISNLCFNVVHLLTPVLIRHYYADCRTAECRYAECRGALLML